MQKNYRLFTPIIALLMALGVVFTIVSFFVDSQLFVVFSLITSVVFLLVVSLIYRANRRISKQMKGINDAIHYAKDDAFLDMPLPTLLVYANGEIMWYNKECEALVFVNQSQLGSHVSDVFPNLPYTLTSPPEGINVQFAGAEYTAYVTMTKRNASTISVIHLAENTQLKKDSYEYRESKPAIALLLVDNYEEMVQDYKDRERSQIMGIIEGEIERYFTSNHGVVTKISTSRYMIVVEERGIKEMIHRKFSLLETIRKIEIDDKMNPTISIGIGRGATLLADAKDMASTALDMCLGRGGDQVAIRTNEGYEFFGGISTGYESRTRVKTRIIAAALAELIASSGNVIIMGHRYSDLDSLGAAVGMLASVKSMNRPAFICIDNEKNLVNNMLGRLKESGYQDQDFRPPEEALKAVRQNTLLIIVDVHVPSMVESEELYKKCKTVVVIDHHRKLVGFIKNATIFYHEPFASSASEMVTELIEYFHAKSELTKAEAEALLAGITLDTKNFVMKTGVRTFEAAAFLRRFGADTVAVKQMFSSSLDSYRRKAVIVSRAESYKLCAVADATEEFEGSRIVASQAADDLMNISGVEASFVLYPLDDGVNVSARSMGRVNVQTIMEQLGGGGHHTMAAAQFPQSTLADIREKVLEGIDDYYDSLPPEQRPVFSDASAVTALVPTHIAAEAVLLQDKSVAIEEEFDNAL